MRIFPKLVKRDWLVILALSLTYFALNLTSLTKLPIFVDEALYLRWAQIAWHDATWRFISLTDGKQPLYTWFVIPFLKVFADPLYAGRFASVVAGYFTFLGSFYTGWLLKDKKLALLAAVLTLTSPYLFFYNRFGVMESLLTAFGIWSFALSILFAKYRRLDLAMILGIVIGLGMLVKSSALFYLIFAPFSLILTLKEHPLRSKATLKYLGLFGLASLFALVIYNVQRLSPWMHMIGEKNSFFTVSYSEIFAEPARLWNNTLDIFRWHFAYTSIPLSLVALLGIVLLLKANFRLGMVLLIWTAGSLGGTAAVARLYAPRYIAFATPFVLMFAAYALQAITKNYQKLLLITLLVVLYPVILISKLLIDPISFPYTSVDEGYVNGWSAGNGTKQIADWAVKRVGEVGPVKVYTEGTFGILPHGLELYADQRVEGLTIEGIYPVNEIPPLRTVEYAADHYETYLVLNNTQTASILDGLELVAEYEKRDPSHSMRLYRVLPR